MGDSASMLRSLGVLGSHLPLTSPAVVSNLFLLENRVDDDSILPHLYSKFIVIYTSGKKGFPHLMIHHPLKGVGFLPKPDTRRSHFGKGLLNQNILSSRINFLYQMLRPILEIFQITTNGKSIIHKHFFKIFFHEAPCSKTKFPTGQPISRPMIGHLILSKKKTLSLSLSSVS